MQSFMCMKKAQGATEYAIFIAAVLVGLIGLQIYFQRAVAGNMKSRSDSVGEQFSFSSKGSTTTKSVQGRSSITDGEDKNYSSFSKGLNATWGTENMAKLVAMRGAVGGGFNNSAYSGESYTGTTSNYTHGNYQGRSMSDEAGIKK
jgi:hypothetical protein